MVIANITLEEALANQEQYELESAEEAEQLDQAIDLCLSGKEIALNASLRVILDRITSEIDAALQDGAEILPQTLMVLCVDEAKRACTEGLIAQQDLPNAALTLCMAAKKALSKRKF